MSVAVALVAIAATLVVTGSALIASARDQSWWAVPALAPVATGLVVRGAGIDVDLPAGRGWTVMLAGTVLLLGVIAGGPLAVWVLERAKPPSGTASPAAAEVLRGGATIGYLELDTPAAREKFIIGTLASLLWAGACGALVFADRW